MQADLNLERLSVEPRRSVQVYDTNTPIWRNRNETSGIGMKIGRNDPCWCGSGIKYKRCHFERDVQQPTARWEAAKTIRQAFSRSICLAHGTTKHLCSKKIARAHTVPKASSLQAIARCGHVYGFIPSLENLERNNGFMEPELVGINRASTFTGFCTFHDDQIFAPIEKADFVGSAEQCLLLAYRALSREHYTKHSSASLAELRRQTDKGKSTRSQLLIQNLVGGFNFGIELGVTSVSQWKSAYDSILNTSNYGAVRACIISLPAPPPVMCSGGFFPLEDFEGKVLQNITNPSILPALITVSAFASGGAGYVVFSWLDRCNEVCSRFLTSLLALRNDKLCSAIVRMLFHHIENVFMLPDWWEGLQEYQRKALIRRMSESANPFIEMHDGKMLTDDGVDFGSWPVIHISTLGY